MFISKVEKLFCEELQKNKKAKYKGLTFEINYKLLEVFKDGSYVTTLLKISELLPFIRSI